MPPLFLGRSIDDGFFVEAEFSELRGEIVHFRAVRVVLGEEAFFEEQELVLRAGGVVDEGDEEALEIDFDAGEQLGQRGLFKVAVVVKGELAGVDILSD